MTDAELLIECKDGLGIQPGSTEFDRLLASKLLVTKSSMKHAGVSDEMLEDDLSVGTIVMGVADLWNNKSGEVKFSPLFYTFLSQLTAGSLVLTVSSNPTDGATNVPVNMQPILTFSNRIKSYAVGILTYDTLKSIAIASELDITGKKLTLKPGDNLDPATKYAIVAENIIAHNGQIIEHKVIGFTT